MVSCRKLGLNAFLPNPHVTRHWPLLPAWQKAELRVPCLGSVVIEKEGASRRPLSAGRAAGGPGELGQELRDSDPLPLCTAGGSSSASPRERTGSTSPQNPESPVRTVRLRTRDCPADPTPSRHPTQEEPGTDRPLPSPRTRQEPVVLPGLQGPPATSAQQGTGEKRTQNGPAPQSPAGPGLRQ